MNLMDEGRENFIDKNFSIVVNILQIISMMRKRFDFIYTYYRCDLTFLFIALL